VTTRRKAGVTFAQFQDARATLRARGYREIRAVNEVPERGTEFGSLWARERDGAEYWLNFRTIGHPPD